MANNIDILIRAKDSASKTIKDVGDNISQASSQSQTAAKRMEGYRDSLDKFTPVAIASAGALAGITIGIKSSIDAANRYQSAMTGLSSIAEAFNVDAGKAKQAAQELAKDGLMTVGEAAGGLKNLLAAGFGLDESVKLMNRFKDSAAFGRQGALGFGEAIVGATEGIKNGNSILVDNAGVTKNLSVMLDEAGYSAQDLGRASSDAGVRQAIFNGILKETQPMLGDATRLSQQYAGEQARMAAATETTKQALGMALQPALSGVMSVLTPVTIGIGTFVSANPALTTGVIASAVAVAGLGASLGVASAALSVIIPLLSVAAGPVGILTLGIGLLAGGTTYLALQQDSAAGAAGRHRTAQEQLTIAKQNAKTATDSLVTAEIGLEQANLRVERAQRTYNEAVNMYGSESLEAREASVSLRQAQYDLASANDVVRQKTDENKAAQDRLANQKKAVELAESIKQGQLRKTSADMLTQEQRAISLHSGLARFNGKVFSYSVRGTFSEEGPKPGEGKGYGILKSSGNAIGTIYSPGGRTLVGENGPELVDLPQGAQVTQAYRTRNELENGAGGGVTNILSGNFTFQNAESVDAFFDRIDKTQRLARIGMAGTA